MKHNIFLLCAVLALSGGSNAEAWFKFTNKTSTTVWVAFSWYHPNCPDGGNWEKAGWWKLLPGQTKTVYGGDLQDLNTYYYYYAEGANGAKWSGPFPDSVPQQAFQWCESVSSTGARTVGFREKYIGSYNNYTINLVK